VLRRTVQVTVTATFYHPHAPVDLRTCACSGEPDRSTGACVAALRRGRNQGIIDRLKSKNQTLDPSAVKMQLLRLVGAGVGLSEVYAVVYSIHFGSVASVYRHAKEAGHIVAPIILT
jgi:hypothetical protein